MNTNEMATLNRKRINLRALTGIKQNRRLIEVLNDYDEIIELYGADYLYAVLASIVLDYNNYSDPMNITAEQGD